MRKKEGYRIVPFSSNRQMAAASASVCRKRNTIHLITEVDITDIREFLHAYQQRTGEKLSFTAYIIKCLARVLKDYPGFNSFRKGRKLILLEDINIGIIIEREVDGERIPEPAFISRADIKNYREIHEEIREAQLDSNSRLGGLSEMTWVRFIPGFLLKTFIRIASRSIRMAKRYGVVTVTAIGMFGSGTIWGVPLSASTVAVTVGTIVKRPLIIEGKVEEREHLCLTISFNHDIIDGAPAARFTSDFSALLKSDEMLQDLQEQEGETGLD